MSAFEGHQRHSPIEIKPSHRGLFKKAAKAAGRSVQGEANAVLANPNASETMRKRAQFAKNAAKFNH